MADDNQQETPEAVIKELNIEGFNPEDKAHSSMIGIITKLRGNLRTAKADNVTIAGERDTYKSKVGTYERTSAESALITETLKGRTIGDQAKFDKYKAKLATGDNWQAELKDLVEDFAVDKKPDDKGDDEKSKKEAADAAAAKKVADDKAAADAAAAKAKEDENKPGFKKNRLRDTKEIEGTNIPAPRSVSERLKLMKDNPEAYKQFRGKQR